MTETETYTIKGRTYELLIQQDDGGGSYDWSVVGLLKRDDGQLFYVEDSGCSCNYFMDYPDEVELQPVADWAQAVEKLRADLPYGFSDNDVMQFAQKLNELRPK